MTAGQRGIMVGEGGGEGEGEGEEEGEAGTEWGWAGDPVAALNGNRVLYFLFFFPSLFLSLALLSSLLPLHLLRASVDVPSSEIWGDKLACDDDERRQRDDTERHWLAFGLLQSLALSFFHAPSLRLCLCLFLACVCNIYCWKLNFNYSCVFW